MSQLFRCQRLDFSIVPPRRLNLTIWADKHEDLSVSEPNFNGNIMLLGVRRSRSVPLKSRSSVRSVCIGNEWELPADSAGPAQNEFTVTTLFSKSLSASLKKLRKRDAATKEQAGVRFLLSGAFFKTCPFDKAHVSPFVHTPETRFRHDCTPDSTPLVKWISTCAISGEHDEPSHLQFLSVTAGADELLRWIWHEMLDTVTLCFFSTH